MTLLLAIGLALSTAACGGTESIQSSPDASLGGDAPMTQVQCGSLVCTAPEVCIVTVQGAGACETPDDAGVCPGGGMLARVGCCGRPGYACARLPLPPATPLKCGGPPSCTCFSMCPCGPCETAPGVYECDCIQS
jgi:hypothetical protein